MRFPARAVRSASLALVFVLHLPAQQPGARGGAIRLEELIDEGKYQAAFDTFQSDVAKAALQWLDPSEMLPYRAKLSVEVGALQQAVLIFKRAEPAMYPPTAAREHAALLLALRDYAEAAKTASKAYRLCIEGGYLKIRIAYCKSIEAEARLRLGDVSAADQSVRTSLELVRKSGDLPPFFYAPRIFYTACLVESCGPTPGDAEAECGRGLALAEKTGMMRRDVSLGYLALAEVRLRGGNLAGAGEAASHSLELTRKLFGAKHQDAVRALQVLAQADLGEGKSAAARSRAEEAVDAALGVFGDGSPSLAQLRQDLARCLDSSR